MSKPKLKPNSVFETDEGDKLLLDPSDPGYRKPRQTKAAKLGEERKAKAERASAKKKQQRQSKTWQRVRPLVGFAFSPYLLIRPVVRYLSVIGNKQFDKVFNPSVE